MAAALAPLVLRSQLGLKALRTRTATVVGQTFDLMGGVSQAEQAAFAARAAQVVLGGQIATARYTDAYLAAYMARLARSRIARPLGVDPALVTGPAVRNGIELVEVYARPAVTARTMLASGATLTEALAGARARAVSSAETDVQLTYRSTAREVMTRTPGVTGYARVADGGACALCLVASTQRYNTEDLLPIHNRCGCAVAPIIGAGFGGGMKVADNPDPPEGTEVAVREHGELGPVLTDAAQAFTGPHDLTR